jgi:hypothetical protein
MSVLLDAARADAVLHAPSGGYCRHRERLSAIERNDRTNQRRGERASSSVRRGQSLPSPSWRHCVSGRGSVQHAIRVDSAAMAGRSGTRPRMPSPMFDRLASPDAHDERESRRRDRHDAAACSRGDVGAHLLRPVGNRESTRIGHVGVDHPPPLRHDPVAKGRSQEGRRSVLLREDRRLGCRVPLRQHGVST